MRTHRNVVLALCVGLMLAGVGRSALAQSPAPPGMPTPGQAAAAVPAATTPEMPLTIPAPPNTTVQVEMDLHDDDLLGVFKSLLRGVGQAANTVPVSPRTPVTSQRGPTDAQIAAILSNADLSDVFKDVTHIHFVMLSMPGAAPVAPVEKTKAGKPLPTIPTVPSLPDQTTFYETAFSAEGGHRIIYVNTDPVHVLMTSFGHARGFAFMVQAPGSVSVLRADGYPDLSKLSALATSIGAAAGKAALNVPTSKLTK